MTLTHEFVEHLPERLQPGVLYVSMSFAIVAHLCPCGCAAEVVTPLTPVDWRMTFDGESITLFPSVGSWGLACRSHYWIDRNQVRWASSFSQAEVDELRRRDHLNKMAYYGGAPVIETKSETPETPEAAGSFVERVWRWLRNPR